MLTLSLIDFLIDIYIMDYVIEFYNCNRSFLCAWRLNGLTPLFDVEALVRRTMKGYNIRGLARVSCFAGAEKISFVVIC